MAKKVALSNKKVEQHNSVLLRIFCILFDYEVCGLCKSVIECNQTAILQPFVCADFRIFLLTLLRVCCAICKCV